MATTRKEIAKSIKTLIVMLQSMRGKEVAVTLRNDSIVRGTIAKVDHDMNIELLNATVEQDLFYVTPDSLRRRSQSSSQPSSKRISREDVGDNFVGASDEDDGAASSSGPQQANLIDDQQRSSSSSSSPTNSGNVMYDFFLVKGSRIRHIDLPADDGCDLLDCTRNEIERLRNRRKQWNLHSSAVKFV